MFEHQAPTGQIPANVLIDDGRPEFAGVGGITSIDSGIWAVVAAWRYADAVQDWNLLDELSGPLAKLMDWLLAHDSNQCGLLEIPEAGDWTDLFARSYHVLYDEVLWYRALVCYTNTLRQLGKADRAAEFDNLARHVRHAILDDFWPTTTGEADKSTRTFTETQFSLGDSRYLVAQISPFSFSWRCDVFGNLLAYLFDVVDRERALMTFRFLWGVGVNEPGPVKNLYPPVQAGDAEWRNYFAVHLLNLPNHYHNGGIWPFIGGLWVRYISKLGLRELARRELVKLAKLCSLGVSHEWEFNEWHHAVTGRPMGKVYQAWSAASFIQACHDLHMEPVSGAKE
jgi:glycogen debranching enzyme